MKITTLDDIEKLGIGFVKEKFADFQTKIGKCGEINGALDDTDSEFEKTLSK